MPILSVARCKFVAYSHPSASAKVASEAIPQTVHDVSFTRPPRVSFGLHFRKPMTCAIDTPQTDSITGISTNTPRTVAKPPQILVRTVY